MTSNDAATLTALLVILVPLTVAMATSIRAVRQELKKNGQQDSRRARLEKG